MPILAMNDNLLCTRNTPDRLFVQCASQLTPEAFEGLWKSMPAMLRVLFWTGTSFVSFWALGS